MNVQNIPSSKEFRKCFIAKEGNTLINADYSGQETVILVNQSLDKDLLEFFRGEENDMHSFIASKIFPQLYGLKLSEIKDKYPDLRNKAKSAGFAIQFGGNGFTISYNLGLPEAEGNILYDSYFKAFPGLRNYYDKLIAKSLKQGYILIDPVTGRRRNFIKPTTNGEKSAVGRKALNSPVQGSAGSITKIALIKLQRFIDDNNLYDNVKITNSVHDEIILEVINEETICKEAAKLLEKAMEDAGAIFCKTIPLKAAAVITPYWQH